MESFVSVLMAVVSWIMGNYQLVISSLVGLLSLFIAFFMLIPGSQPEAFLQKIVDFLAKYSKK